MNKFILIVSVLFLTNTIVAGKDKTDISTLSNKHAPLSFVENKGQITDQNNNPRPDVQFKVAAAAGLNVFIGNGAIHYQFNNPVINKASQEKDHLNNTAKLHHGKSQITDNVSFDMYRMDVELVGADKNAQVTKEELQDYYENYFTANTGDNNVIAHAYGKITYKNVYPNIDWVLYMRNGQLEHEFVIKEGGKVQDIQLKYGGAVSLKVNEDGSLTATTPQGTITEQAPTSYQEDGRPVASSFKLKDNTLSYSTESYTGKLVIDPALKWGTYYGGNYITRGAGLVTDGAGHLFMTGNTTSAYGIATIGAYQVTYGGAANPYNWGDAYIAEFDTTGALHWATYYGGSDDDGAVSIAIDASANLYITGNTASNTGIATAGAYQASVSGMSGQHAFLAKFNSAGAIQWGTYFYGTGGFGGFETSWGNAVATDASGNVYFTGMTSSPGGITTPGVFMPSAINSYEVFLAKFSSAGSRIWATYYAGSNMIDQGEGVGIDPSGNVYITGITYCTSSAYVATAGALQTFYGGDCGGFIAKFNSTGSSLLWGTYLGYAGTNGTYGLAFDPASDVYVTGQTGSEFGIATSGAYQDYFGTSFDSTEGFLAKFNSTGSVLWSTYIGATGGTGNAYTNCVATDATGNVYVAGSTTCPAGVATTGAYQTTNGGSEDAFLAKFNSSGLIYACTYFGGGGWEASSGLALDANGNAYLAGFTSSSSGIATIGAYKTSIDTALYDAFLTKFAIDCSGFGAGTISGTTNVCPAANITLSNIAAGGVWSSSNTAVGSVGSATGIVTGISAGTTTISFTITSACGTAYATRVITVNSLPSAGVISGLSTVCTGTMLSLSDAVTGGVWSSSAIGVATVSSTGTLTGTGSGTATISYAVTSSCGTSYATAVVSVNVAPTLSAVTGTLSVCSGFSVSLSDSTAGGIWSSTSAGIADVGTSGLVTGISAGTSLISYTITTACGSSVATVVITVNPLPAAGAITGPSVICIGSTIGLTDTATGGIWSSTASSIATVGSSTGLVTGIAAGTATISYAKTNSCGAMAASEVVTVTATPVAGSISGSSHLCIGGMSHLQHLLPAVHGVLQTGMHSCRPRVL